MTYKILIVDDEAANIRLLERLFRQDYQVLTALSGNEALDILTQHEIALIITDQRMPGMTGVELLKRASEMRRQTLRIILTGYTDVNTLVDAINSGVVYKYVTKPWDNTDLKQTVSRALEFYEANKRQHELGRQYERLSQSLTETERGFTQFIADSLNTGNYQDHGHARRTSGFATAIGYRLGLTEEELKQLSLAAFFHDIGNAGYRDAALQKGEAPINKDRRIEEFMSERSAFVLSNAPHLNQIANVVRHSSEHFDGSGFPYGLTGEQIPLQARIVAVANFYDEMTRPSDFRQSLSHGDAVEELQKYAGTRFDPAIVEAFCRIEALRKIRRTIELNLTEMQLSAANIFEVTDNLSLAELLQQIKTNPLTAMHVLRKANASYPGEPTAQLLTAAMRLGKEKLLLLLEEYGLPITDPNMQEWSEFALRRAVAAQMLAAHTGLMNPDDAYTLGLLYDIGEMLLANLFPDEMCELKGLDEDIRYQTEIENFGVESAQISRWMLGRVGLPEAFTSAINSKCKLMRIYKPAALLMSVADRIAGTGEEYKVTVIDSLEADVLAILRLSRADLNRIYECAAAFSSEIITVRQETCEFVF